MTSVIISSILLIGCAVAYAGYQVYSAYKREQAQNERTYRSYGVGSWRR